MYSSTKLMFFYDQNKPTTTTTPAATVATPVVAPVVAAVAKPVEKTPEKPTNGEKKEEAETKETIPKEDGRDNQLYV